MNAPSPRKPRTLPLSFGVYDEGAGMLSLYLHDMPPQDLLDLTQAIAAGGQVVALTPGPLPRGARALEGGGWTGGPDCLAFARPPYELVLIDPQVSPERVLDQVPSCLLAAPDWALPPELGARAAVVVDEAGEAVVLSRQRELLARCLAPPLEHTLRVALGGEEPPEAPLQALYSLIAPMEDASWCELSVEDSGRYRTLTLAIRDGEQGGRTIDRSHWVAPRRGGSWRADWSW